jgi:hypothetical protein
MNKLETLGVKKSKAPKMPIQMRLGMDQKQKEREQKKLQEAKDIGLYDKSLKHLYAAAVKPKEKKSRDKGITSGIGKMRGSTLTLSKNEIKRKKGGKSGSKSSKGGKGGKGGKKGRRWNWQSRFTWRHQIADTDNFTAGPPMTDISTASKKTNILIGATGSVASIKIPKLVKLLRQVWINCYYNVQQAQLVIYSFVMKRPDYDIKVVSTKPALHFFDSSTVDAEVITDENEWSVSVVILAQM